MNNLRSIHERAQTIRRRFLLFLRNFNQYNAAKAASSSLLLSAIVSAIF